MRVWLLQGKQEEAAGLGSVLRAWAQHPAAGPCQVEAVTAGPGLIQEAKERRPDVLVLAGQEGPGGPWLAEVLAAGAGLVVAVPPDRAGPFWDLALQHAVCVVPLPPSAEGLGLALGTAHAAARRQRSWQEQIAELQQRLNDRILIERAKGILVQRLRISEEEAYRRLRLLSRRQRRQIRDIARSLLDAQELLLPETNGFTEQPGPDDPWDPERPMAPSEKGT
jgi:response regulator NasT